jgi:hypothetical protein
VGFLLTLLKYSKREAKHDKIHSAIQAKIWASPFCCAELAKARRACITATRKLPKQMEPKDVVMVRMKLELTAEEQQPHSSGAYPEETTRKQNSVKE